MVHGVDEERDNGYTYQSVTERAECRATLAENFKKKWQLSRPKSVV